MTARRNKKSLAKRLRAGRKNAGLSQAQVAKLLGLHRPTISEIEAGRRRVAAEEVKQFAEIYEVSVSWLLDGPSGQPDERLRLVARELPKLASDDLERVIQLIQSLGEPSRQGA